MGDGSLPHSSYIVPLCMCPHYTGVLPSGSVSSLLSIQVSFPLYMHPAFLSLWGHRADCIGTDPNALIVLTIF